jgi:tetratricopeptide (TPR) repeat protein
MQRAEWASARAGAGPRPGRRWGHGLPCSLALLLVPAGAVGQVPDPGAPPAVTSAPVPAPSANPLALQKVAMGDQFVAAKDFRLALYAYLDAVNLDPRSVPARLRLAALYARLDHLEHAIAEWEFALALDPGNSEAVRSMAEARATLERRAAGLPDGGGPPASTSRIYKLTPEKPAQPPAPAAPSSAASPPAAKP